MNQFDIAQAFIDQYSNTTSVEELKNAFARATQELGFRYFACCSHVDLLRPPAEAVVFHSYPAAWVRYLSERGYCMVDPVFRHAAHTLLPFSWDEEEFRATLAPGESQLLQTATEFGLEHGYTIPIHRPYAVPASCSVIPNSATIQPATRGAVSFMAAFMHEALYRSLSKRLLTRSNQLRLSNRERQCLELAAQGKSDWEIAMIVGIAERTVHAHIERAKRRLGVATRVQAIVQSLSAQQFSFSDVIKTPSLCNRHQIVASNRLPPSP